MLAALTSARVKARDAARIANAHQISLALEQYNSSYGTYQVAGSGISGGGRGLFARASSSDATYQDSIMHVLAQSGYYSSGALRDPVFGDGNYYVGMCTSTGAYNIYLNLEEVGLQQASSTIQAGCDGANALAAGMNAIVGQGASGGLGGGGASSTPSMVFVGSFTGYAVVDPTTFADQMYSVAVGSDGVYTAGFDGGGGNEWRIEKRSLTDLSLLWAQTENPSAGADVAYQVVVGSDGIYVGGYDEAGGSRKWRLEKRSLIDGAILWTQIINPTGSYDESRSIALGSDGIYLAGWDAAGGYEWRVEKRSLVDGSAIWAINDNLSGGNDAAKTIAVGSDGVYIGGYDAMSGNGEWRVEKRSLANGAIIWSKGADYTANNDEVTGIAVGVDGVYIVGWDYGGGHEWRLEKRDLATGNVLWTTTENPSSGNDAAYAVAVGSDAFYVAGYDSSLGYQRWLIEKRNFSDGSIVWAKTSSPSAAIAGPGGISVGPDEIYVGGYDSAPGNAEWRIEKYQ